MITTEVNNTHKINPFEDDLNETIAINYNNYLIDCYKKEIKAYKDQTLKYFLEARSEQRRPELMLYIKDFIAILSLKSSEQQKGGYLINDQDNHIGKYHKEMVDTCKNSISTLKDRSEYLKEKNEIKKLAKPLPKKATQLFNDFDDVFIDTDHKQKAYEILKAYKHNGSSLFEKDSLNIRKGKNAELIRLIKRFEKEGYFHKIPGTKLHPLLGKKFNSKTNYQNYNQTKAMIDKLE